MTTRKHFPTPTKDASKLEEITWLENLAEDIQDGTYLKDLFTEKMVAWVSEQIRNDFTPDLLGALQQQWAEGSKLSTDMHNMQEEYRAEIVKLELELNQKEMRLASAIHELDKSTDDYRTLLKVREDEISDLQREYWGMQGTVAEKDDKIAALELQVVTLKAKLFDLLTLG